MTSTTLHVALIGAGGIARDQHLPGWAKVPEARVVAIVDPSPESLAAAKAICPAADCITDYRSVLNDPHINVVDICVPSALHSEVAVAALQAGKHVLCEKPMATSHVGAAAMLHAWRASGKKLMIGQHLRFDASVSRLRAYLDLHPPGDIYFARAQWLRRRRLPGKPGFTDKRLSGGGALYDLGVHMLDLAWWMMGSPRPVSVSGRTYNLLARRKDLGSEWGDWDPQSIDVEDLGVGLVRFENGATLSLEVSWLMFQPQDEFWRLQLFGTQAGILWPECQIVGETQKAPWDVQLSSAKGEKAHHEVIRQFARAVVDDTPVPIPPEQSALVISILESLYESSATGREVAIEQYQT